MKKHIDPETGALITERKNPNGSLTIMGTSKYLIPQDDLPLCPDCGGTLHPQWYGFNCRCGQMFGNDIKPIKEF